MRRPCLWTVVVLLALTVGSVNAAAQVSDGRIVSQYCQGNFDTFELYCDLFFVGARDVHIPDGTDRSGLRMDCASRLLGSSGSHRAVGGALVTGSWSDGSSGSCTTSNDGRRTVSGPGLAKKTASISFTVATVNGTAMAYTPAQNHDPDSDSTGTSVTVGKP